MKEQWLEILEWIQLGFTFLFLVFMAGVFVYVIWYYNLEFNRLWKTRACIVGICFMWALSLLLGRHQLWKPDDGLIPVSESRFRTLCQAHVFLTFGIWQPLFFLVILIMLRSKSKAKLQLYSENPNKVVLSWALLWCIPVTVVHVIIVGLNGGNVNEPEPIVWTTYTSQYDHCVIPILSTGAFAIFYAVFIVYYVLVSSKLFTRLINRNLRYRVRWTQLFFVCFFPFEILVRLVLLFVSKYESAYEGLYHTYFFMDLIVCIVGVIEFGLFPVMDAAVIPLIAGVTVVECKDYVELEEARTQKRKATRTIPALARVLSDIEHEKPNTNTPKGKITNIELTKMDANKTEDRKSAGSKIEDRKSAGKNEPTKSSSSGSLNVILTAAYPTDITDIDDVFADMNQNTEDPRDHSLKLSLDGVFLEDPDS